MKKKAPGNQEEIQDLVPRGMEGKEEDSSSPAILSARLSID